MFQLQSGLPNAGTRTSWPSRAIGEDMPEVTFVHPLFGSVRFKTAHENKWVFGDQITFLSGFNVADIEPVTVPQLAHIPVDNGHLRFHKRAQAQLLAVFADIEALGLLPIIKTCAGALNFRLRRPTSGKLSKLPSNHAFGTAIDLNADDKSLGASVAPIAPIFEAFKFKWGKAFNDPMHFEVEAFVDHPRSVVQNVTVALDGQNIDLGARNLMGNLVANASKTGALPGVSAQPLPGAKIKFTGPKGAQTLPAQRFGDHLAFVPLIRLCAVAGFNVAFDNVAKVAKLIKIET
jgi:D-alanyl-D-alanine carboxypeptidase